MTTKVVNIKTHHRGPNTVYIGRPSIWGNPYHMHSESDRMTVIEKYRTHLRNQIEQSRISKAQLAALDGKELACYCKPKPCHGDILLEAVKWATGHRATPPWNKS